MVKHETPVPVSNETEHSGPAVQTGRRRNALMFGCVAAVLIIAAAAFWLFSRYIFVCGDFYPKGEDIDLRDKTISVEQYQIAAAEYPQIHIYWNIPIGGQYYDCTLESIAVGDFSPSEISNFLFFDHLKAVDGSGVSCYEALAALREAMPEVEVSWVVRIGEDEFPDDAEDILIDVPASYTQLSDLLPYLPALERVDLRNAELEPENAAELLEEAFPHVEFIYNIEVCGQKFSNDALEISLPGADAALLAELAAAKDRFRGVETIDLGDALADADEIIALRRAFDGAKVLCRLCFYGVETSSDAQELDLSEAEIGDGADIGRAVAAMADLKTIIVQSDLSDEDLEGLNGKYPGIEIIRAE